MPEPIENYTPQKYAAYFHGQAMRIWIAGVVVVALWVLLILLPPIALYEGASNVATPVYGFFSYICHQKPERSFFLLGHQFGVCSRCFGVYFGLLLGFVIYPLWRAVDSIEPPARMWLFLSMIPIGIDWSLGVFGIWENTHLSRFITGTILGVACATYIVPALVDIGRNLTQRRRV
jgi:uncharacterized membrane protein